MDCRKVFLQNTVMLFYTLFSEVATENHQALNIPITSNIAVTCCVLGNLSETDVKNLWSIPKYMGSPEGS